ncbi:MAG TPA: hypothetical protein VN937_12465 [Blastocatellia bacterium]|nr:hypothetical protein [Blastocatellia bacterium]
MPPRRAVPNGPKLSRRDFARRAALAAATATLSTTTSAHTENSAPQSAQAESPQAAQLSAVGEAQLQTILARSGKWLTNEQKADLRRLVAQAQKTSEALRSFSLDNSDEPAMIFHVYRSDR